MGKYDDIAEEAATVRNSTDSDVQAYVKYMVHISTNGVIYQV